MSFASFNDLLAYRDEQVELLHAGKITRQLFGRRIRCATKTFNSTYRGPSGRSVEEGNGQQAASQ
jgi:hypothetical protein